MVHKFNPELNKVYLIKKYTLFHIIEGSGGFQVDFKSYNNWKDKIIFLEKGQYIKFLSENFTVRQIAFEDELIFRNKEVRVLFKHLLELGYINFQECTACQQFLTNTVFSFNGSDIIDISSKQWYWQNPFQANKEEYQIIFDIKEVIDNKFRNQLTNDQLSKVINLGGINAQALFKSKVGVSIKSMLGKKRLLESKKELAFSNKSVKEIAYDLGFKDPSYFIRVFKKASGKNPNAFRTEFEYESRDTFIQNLFKILENHHKQERSVDFYADQMHVSVKTLSRKVRDQLNISMGQLIRQEIINSAKTLLNLDLNIVDISLQLGFEEANHFSTFFKHYTGLTPSDYKSKKYN